ncbi:MAG: hypothetical protein HY841_09645 [Bacteroidetes bacterium]|nr:hypothetical protein [Bacteroidota bacterium]
MKNLSGKTSEAKQSNLLDKRELVLAVVFFLTALLIFVALSSIAQTPGNSTCSHFLSLINKQQ